MRTERWLVLALLTACAGGPARSEPDPRDARIAELEAQLAALEAELQSSDNARAELKGRLQTAEQRLGVRPFAPLVVKRAEPDLRFAAGKARRIDAPGARPTRADLGRAAADWPGYVVAYWATWCKPCTTPEEIAALGRLRDELESLGSVLVGVAVDDLKTLEGDARLADFFYPIWQREDAHIQWLPKAFIDRVGLGLPLFVVVDADGHMRYWHASALDPRAHRELVTAAVSAGRSARRSKTVRGR